jgi:magnesium transporter
MTLAQLEALFENKDWQTLRDRASADAAPEIADLLRALERPNRMLLFRALSRDVAAEVFVRLTPQAQDALLRELADDEARELLATLNPDDRTHLLAELPGQVTSRLLRLLSHDDLREVRLLLGYPDESVGRLMTPDYVAVHPDWTIAGALGEIRRQGTDSETIDHIYVVDASGRLIDDIELRKIHFSVASWYLGQPAAL